MRKIKLEIRTIVIAALIAVFTPFASAQSSQPLPTDEQVVTRVNEYMKAAQDVDGFSGTILVARDGKPIVSKGYGMANVELGVANAPDFAFRLGSITKQFTGMAIAMLQERGKLKVDDPICDYIADCPEIWKPISIDHLLRHTSGITNYTAFPDFAKTTVSPVATGQMTERLKQEKLDFAPGAKMSYSNSGYFLLGVIIEKTSGKTYADFLQENIFTPLGMQESGYDDPLRIIMHRAAGYQRQIGKLLNAAYTDMSVPYAAGSLYSTTGDLLKWDQALYGEKLASKQTINKTFTPSTGESGYGYGWGISKKFGRRSISHGGGIYGFATDISRYPDDKVTVIVLSNVQGAPAGRISTSLAAIVFGADYEIPREHKEVAIEAKLLEKYTGEYKIEQLNVVITVTLEGGKLLGQVGGQSKFALSPESEMRFFSKDVNAVITFAKDEGGQMTGLTLNQGGSGYLAKKIK
ncbi:MAG: serine hydrolase [Pyrinomonadaceae bacterium]